MQTAKVIDISYWQRHLNWEAVVNDGVKGVIIKISEGTTVESSWWTHLSNAEENGLPWGVYCYGHATTPEEAQQEANEVLYLLDGRIPPMGIWYDVEDQDMFADGVDTTACASAFISFLNEHGLPCGIYTSSLKCTDYMVNSLRPTLLADYVPWWIADYRCYCGFAETYPDKLLAGWQWSDKEYIAGTNVDMNEWYLEIGG